MKKANKQNSSAGMRARGFTIIELLLVVAVIGIIGGYAVPTTLTAVANIRLRGSAADFAGLVQRARIAAIQKNTTYTVKFGLPTGNGAYLDLDGNGSFTTGEPMIQFGGSANQVSAPGGTTGNPSNVNAAGGPLSWTATSGNVSFNARGLTCSATATPCGTNVNYIFYFNDTRYNSSHGWAAVSITAAARSKVWLWTGSSWAN